MTLAGAESGMKADSSRRPVIQAVQEETDVRSQLRSEAVVVMHAAQDWPRDEEKHAVGGLGVPGWTVAGSRGWSAADVELLAEGPDLKQEIGAMAPGDTDGGDEDREGSKHGHRRLIVSLGRQRPRCGGCLGLPRGMPWP